MGASFKDLVVWQKAILLCSEIYGLTASFPSSEQFGLTNQMRRASVSIASNIAEGNGRSTKGEYVSFLVTREQERAEELSAEISRMLNALMNKLKG